MAGHIDAASAPLRDSLVAATDKLGSIPELVLHGGGNSSVKVDWVSVTGKTVPTLLVKGSGHDMAGITAAGFAPLDLQRVDRKSTRLNSSHVAISYAVFCLKKTKIPV